MNRFRDWYRRQPGLARPMILAHRGDSFRGPENTLQAARLGLESGADAWELDVRLTLDGHPVVIHDESLRRTTDVATRFAFDERANQGFLVSQFTLEEIRTLDAGSWFVERNSAETRSATGFGTISQLDPVDVGEYRSGSVRIPTLLEALEWTSQAQWLVNVEIKPTTSNAVGLVDAVLDGIRRLNAWDFVTVSSFDHDVVDSFTRQESRVATGALIAGPLDARTEAWIDSMGIDAVHGPPWSLPSGSKRTLLVYTVNDGELASRLAAAGAAGLFTDDPVTMMTLFPINRS